MSWTSDGKALGQHRDSGTDEIAAVPVEVGRDGDRVVIRFAKSALGQRGDRYRGSSVEGRIRVVLEALGAIRSEVGRDFPLTLRISGHERVAGGLLHRSRCRRIRRRRNSREHEHVMHNLARTRPDLRLPATRHLSRVAGYASFRQARLLETLARAG